MTPDEIKSAITLWCNQDTGMQLVEDRSEPGTDFILGLRSSGQGAAGTVPVEVRLDEGGDHLLVTSTSTASAAPGEIRTLLDSRPASVRGDTSVGGVLITSHVYTDGFSKNALIGAVEEVAKTRSLLDGLAGATAADLDQTSGAAAAAATETRPEPWAAAQSVQPEPWAEPRSVQPELAASTLPTQASTLPTPSFGSAGSSGGGYTPLSGQPAPQQHPAASAFAPTHTVPPQGMQAWAAPDPNGAVVATLGGGLPIQITEVRGAWAHVLCSNGWTGWVDGRIIGVAR
jgi:Bacterial SH3 domain